jgi:uncharacterized protein
MKANVGRVKNVSGLVENLSLEREPGLVNLGTEALKFLEKVRFTGTVTNRVTTLLVQGEVTALVELECSRCGKKISYPVRIPFEETYSNQPQMLEGAEDEIHGFEGDEIDIFPQVIQAILLDLPMKVLCREDCRGLCPECGENLNERQCLCAKEVVDPRLLALKNLLDDSSTEGGVSNGSTKKKDI